MAANGHHLERAPHDPDDFFAEVMTLVVEGRSGEAYEYKTKWYPFVMDQMSPEETRRLDNIDAEFFLRGHIPAARERSRFPTTIDPSLQK